MLPAQELAFSTGLSGYRREAKNQKDRELFEEKLQQIYDPYFKSMPAVELNYEACDQILTKAGVGITGNSPAAMCNALALAFGYEKLDLLIHSMDLRVENGQLFVRCVVDNSPLTDCIIRT